MCACSSRDHSIDIFNESLDLCVPPRAKVAQVGPTAREFAILREVIGAIRLVGAILLIGGGAAAAGMAGQGGVPRRAAVPVIGLVLIPGVLYLVAACGLVRRRYWAWGMSMVTTFLLLFTVLGVFVYFAAITDQPRHRGFALPAAVYALIPALILRYMLRALPVIRDAQLLVRSGFQVLPPADPAAPQAVRELKPAPGGDAPSPAPTPPAS